MENNQTYKPVDRNMNFKNLKKIRDRGYESGGDHNGKIHSYHPDHVDERIAEMAAVRVIKEKVRSYEELIANDPYFSIVPHEAVKLRFAAGQLMMILEEIKEACR